MFEYHDNNGIPLFTLTSVVDTPLGQYELAVDAEKRIATFGDEELAKKRIIFEEQASHFIKDFAKDYGKSLAIFACGTNSRLELTFHLNAVYVDYFLSCKTKLMSGSANRECVEYHTGRLMSLFGGKITGIFHAENFVFDWLNAKLGSVRDAGLSAPSRFPLLTPRPLDPADYPTGVRTVLWSSPYHQFKERFIGKVSVAANTVH